MKKLLIIPLVIGTLFTGALLQESNQVIERVDANAPYPYTCPEGSYPIGDGACKLEPTGCPFGDSIPMEKCSPPPDIECNADWTSCKPRETKPQPPVASEKPKSTTCSVK
jgi:hypothetical protein